MLKDEVRTNIIAPLLKASGLWSEAAEILIYGTGLIESNYNHVVQTGSPPGGGLGYWQIEPKTYFDLIKYLKRPENQKKAEVITSSLFYVMFPMDENALIWNAGLGCIMARILYLRVPAALPPADNAVELSKYYKRYYNTIFGKADVKVCEQVFQSILDSEGK